MNTSTVSTSYALLGRWFSQLSQRPGIGAGFFSLFVGLLLLSTACYESRAASLPKPKKLSKATISAPTSESPNFTIEPSSTTYAVGQSVTVTITGIPEESYLVALYADANTDPGTGTELQIDIISKSTGGSGNTITLPQGQTTGWFIIQFKTENIGQGRVLSVVNAADANDYLDSEPFEIVAASSSPCTSVSISPASQTITSGGSVTLTASGADSYTWSTGQSGSAITVSNVTNATTISVTGVTGQCSATASAAITTTLNCSVTFTGSLTACQYGGFYSITANLPGTNQGYAWAAPADVNWLTNNEAIFSAGFTTAGVKTLTVTATNEEGCTVSATYSVTAYAQPSLTVTAQPATQPANANLLPDELNFLVANGSSLTLSVTGANSYTWGHENETTPTIVFTANDPLNFQLVGTSQKGCSAKRILYIDVQNCQTTLMASASAVCIGGTVSLTALNSNSLNPAIRDSRSQPVRGAARVAINNTPSVSYTWVAPTGATLSSPATGSVVSASFTTTGVKTFTAITATVEGCVSTTTLSITVNGTTITISPSTTSIGGGQSASLTASGADSYTWSTSSTNSSISVSPLETTVYSVTGSKNGCVSPAATATVTVDCGTQVMADAISTTQTVALSPTNCSVTLTGTGYGTGYTITGPGGYVFSAVYRKVGYYTINGLKVTQPGTYTLTVSYADACGRTSSDTMTYVVTGEACK